jgi:hypothetical protein
MGIKKVVGVLLKANADVSIQGKYGTPFEVAGTFCAPILNFI